MQHIIWADRGQQVAVETADNPPTGARFLGAARLGGVQMGSQQFCIALQVRGSAWVEAREGRFRLRQGDWIALEKDSRPLLQTDRDGLCIALAVDADVLAAMGRFADCTLYAGRGRVDRRDRRTALRLWREAAERMEEGDSDAVAALRPLLLHLASVQGELGERVARCPGRSRSRKRQVFGRLQRARLYMEGNCDRVVRIGELAELTSFSSWYFSKTFQSLYDESPQAAAARMRLENAARLLHDSDLMIGEVAAASGFDNCCSFARAFRARFGMSATRYRAGGRHAHVHRGSGERASTDSAKTAGGGRKAMARSGT